MDKFPRQASLLPHSWRHFFVAVVMLTLVIIGLALSWHSTSDLDLPLHDRTGRLILDGEGVPQTNQYSFTAPDHSWVDHEWAFQVLVAVAGKTGGGGDIMERARGWQGLRLILTALLLGALVLDLVPAWRRGHHLALLGPVTLAGLAMLWTRLTLRPELLSYALFILVIHRVEASFTRHDESVPAWRSLVDPRRPGGMALVLTLIWHQVHGFAVIAVLIWILAGLLIKGSPTTRRRRWTLALGGAALALLSSALTPAGLDGLVYPLKVVAQFGRPGVDLQQTISELVPIFETRGSLALTLSVFAGSLAWGMIWTVANWGRISLLRLSLWILAALAAWQGQRMLGLYAVSFLLLHRLHDDQSEQVMTPWQRLQARIPDGRRSWLATPLLLGIPVASIVLAAFWMTDLTDDTFYLREGVARRWGTGVTPSTYPVQQASRLAGLPPGRVANNIDAASTLIAMAAGQVAIDGRTEAYPATAWRDYLKLKSAGTTAMSQLRTWQAAAVCLTHRNQASHPLIQSLLMVKQWTLVDVDATGVLFLPTQEAQGLESLAVLRQGGAAFRDELAASPTERNVRLADEGASWASLLNIIDERDLSEEILDLALVRCQDHPSLHHNKGNHLLAQGEFRGALRHFQIAGRMNRNAAPPLVNAGSCLMQLGRPTEGEKVLSEAVRRDPQNFEGWANLAELRRHLGDNRGAAKAYGKALELRPNERRLRARAAELSRP